MRLKMWLCGFIVILLLCDFKCYSRDVKKSEEQPKQTERIKSVTVSDDVVNNVRTIQFKGVEDITDIVSTSLRKGGTIRVTGGVGIISQPLVFYKDNTHLIIDKNTILKWSHPTYGVILRTLYTVDKKTILNNISVEGGIWEMGGADKNVGGPPAIMMIGVKNLKVKDITMYDPFKFFFGFGNIDGFEISSITMNLRNTSIAGKDGLHFAGGVRNGLISNIRGNTTDDLVALNFGGDIVGDGGENGNGDMMAVGDSYNVAVKDIYSDNAMEVIRLLADDNHKCTDITIDGVYGAVKNHSCISISGWMYEGHTAKFGDIVLSNIHVQTPSTIDEGYSAWHTPIVLVGNHWNRIVPCTVKSLTINGCVVTQSKGMLQTPVRVIGNTTIDSLTIDGLIVNSLEDVDLSGFSVIDIGHPGQKAKIKNLTFTNCYIEKTAVPFDSLIHATKGSVVERARINNNTVGTILPKKSRRVIVKNNNSF